MKDFLKIISIVGLSVLITLGIVSVMNKNNIELSDFSVTSFNLNSEMTTYTAIDNYYIYDGTGIITCKDTKNDYMAEIKMTNKTTDKTNYTMVLITNGEGSFMTYDTSDDLTNNSKPNYSFDIIGFLKIEK